VRWLRAAQYAASLALYCTGVHLLHPRPLNGVLEYLGAAMVAWSGVVVMLRRKENE
jgi:hypothetical protein